MTTENSSKLFVTVVKARDLSTQSITGSCDAFCWVSFDKQKFRTKTVKDSNPSFSQSFTINVVKPFESVEVSVWDERKLSSEEFLGKIVVPLVDIASMALALPNTSEASSIGSPYSQREFQKWFVLKKRNEKDKDVKGEILLQLQYKFIPAWDCIYKAYHALTERQWNIAKRLLDEAIDAFPNYYQLYSWRSQVGLGLFDPQSALADANKIVELNPEIPEGYYRVGNTLFATDDWEKAEEFFKLGLSYDPTDLLCKKGIETIRKNETLQKVRKTVIQAKKQFDEQEYHVAVEYWNDAIQQDPKNCELYLYRAITYVAMGEHAPAVQDAMEIVSIDPEWSKTQCWKQGILMKQGQVNMMLKKRWCVLKHYFLYYYENPKDAKPKGVIVLLKFELQKRSAKNFRIVTPTRTYELKAETENERDQWVAVLEQLWNLPTISLPQTITLYTNPLKEQDPMFFPITENTSYTARDEPNQVLISREDSFIERKTVAEPPKWQPSSVPKHDESQHKWQPSSLPRTLERKGAPHRGYESSDTELKDPTSVAFKHDSHMLIDEVEPIQEDENRRSGPISTHEISTSESRYFKKFGLTPPEQNSQYYSQPYSREEENEAFIPKKRQPQQEESGCCCCIV